MMYHLPSMGFNSWAYAEWLYAIAAAMDDWMAPIFLPNVDWDNLNMGMMD